MCNTAAWVGVGVWQHSSVPATSGATKCSLLGQVTGSWVWGQLLSSELLHSDTVYMVRGTAGL